MAMYPERPIYSPWSDIGSALTQGAGIVNEFQQSRNALQALVDKRAEAAMERQRQQSEDAMKAKEFAMLQDKYNREKIATDIQDSRDTQFSAYAQGERKETRPASSMPYAAPGLGPNNEASMPTPAQYTTRPRTRQELVDKALELRQITPDKYMDATQPETGLTLEDRIALEQAKAGLLAGRPMTPYQEQMLGVIKDRTANSTANREHQQANQQFGQEQKLQDKFLTQTKDFREVRDAFGRVQVSAKDPSAAGDLSLIFNYMKMLDPGSTVREGEFATAAQSGSFGDRIQAATSKYLNGERLSPDQRADFLSRSKALYLQQAKQAKKTEGETKKQAQAYNLDASRVTTDLEFSEDAAPSPKGNDQLQEGATKTNSTGRKVVLRGGRWVAM